MTARTVAIVLLSAAATSCSHTSEVDKLVLGCYDVQQTPPGPVPWPAIRLSDDGVAFRDQYWSRVYSVDPAHPLSEKSRYRFTTNAIEMVFPPDDYTVSDNYGSSAKLAQVSSGWRGTLTTVTMAAVTYQFELTRRSCDMTQ